MEHFSSLTTFEVGRLLSIKRKKYMYLKMKKKKKTQNASTRKIHTYMYQRGNGDLFVRRLSFDLAMWSDADHPAKMESRNWRVNDCSDK